MGYALTLSGTLSAIPDGTTVGPSEIRQTIDISQAPYDMVERPLPFATDGQVFSFDCGSSGEIGFSAGAGYLHVIADGGPVQVQLGSGAPWIPFDDTFLLASATRPFTGILSIKRLAGIPAKCTVILGAKAPG